jgi:putative hydrolase of the HAD superfamily
VSVPTPTLSQLPPELPRHHPVGPIRAVCLDIDDTLVDNCACGRAGLAALVGRDHAWDPHRAWDQWSELTELHYDRFLSGEVDFDTMRLQRAKAFFAERGEWLSDHELAHREACRMAAVRGAWRLFDDALPCLHQLRAAGLGLAAVTNAPGGHQRSKLAAVGLIDAFDVLVIAGEVGVAKPDPAIFQLACARLGVRPDQTVHVGDRLDLDARAAVDAGLVAGVWLARHAAVPTDLPFGVHVIASLLDLPDLLAAIPAPRASP